MTRPRNPAARAAGARLRALRDARGLSLKRMEAACGGRFTAGQVSGWERGERDPACQEAEWYLRFLTAIAGPQPGPPPAAEPAADAQRAALRAAGGMPTLAGVIVGAAMALEEAAALAGVPVVVTFPCLRLACPAPLGAP